MIQLLDKLDILISVDENLSILQELVINAAANGKFGIDDQTIRDNFQSEELDPINWEIMMVEEIAEFTNGYAFKSSDYRDDGIGIIRMSDLKNGEISVQQLKYVSKSFLSELNSAIQVKPNDLVIGMSGSIGRPCFNRTEKTFLLNQRVGKLTPNLGLVTPEYLAISLASLEQHFLQISMGSAIKNLSTAQIKQAKILLPPLAIQKVIVNHYEKFLSLTKSLKASLSSDKSAALKFRNSVIDAVSSAQTPEELLIAWQRIQNNWDLIANTPASIESLRGLILDLAFTGRLTRSSSRSIHTVTRDEALSEIPWSLFAPKDWNLTTLGDACFKISDGTHKTPKYQDSGVPFLSIKDISSGIIDFSKTRFISQSEHDELSKRIRPSRGDVLFCRIGTLGKAITIETDREFSIFVSLGLLRPKRYLNPKFLELALNSPISHKQFESIKAGGSHTQKLNLGAMSKYIIWYPDPETQSEIVKQVSDLMALCDQLELKMKIMESLSEKFVQSVVFSTT